MCAVKSENRHPGAVVLRVWPLDQQPQHLLGTCEKCKFLASSPRLTESEILVVGPRVFILTNLLVILVMRVKVGELVF